LEAYDPVPIRVHSANGATAVRFQREPARHGAPIQVLGQGSMLCFHPQREPIRRPADHAGVSPNLRKLMHLEMNLRGFYLARRGFMSLSLPLTDADHDALVQAFEGYMEDYFGVLATMP
jgi:glutamate-1-semialdehyde 2,1-aminomutase